MPTSKKHFDDHIVWFVKHIRSRMKMLPGFAHAAGMLTKNVSEKLDKFIGRHGYDKTFDADGEITQYAVPGTYSSRHRILRTSYENAIIFADLLPKMTLVSLVSLYDAYLARLIRSMLDAKPEMINGSGRQLTFAQISEFGSIEAAREYIIDAEIEGVLRGSHSDQFDWLEGRLGITLRSGLPSWSKFIELTERRNLLVHADGVVNRQYLSACKKAGVSIPADIKLGSKLQVTPEYYDEACECVAEIGIKLGQTLWRKLLPEELEEADDSIITVTYDLLMFREYKLAEVVARFGTMPFFKHSCAKNEHYLKVNLAIALKGQEKNAECLKLIDSVDWSALSEELRLAAAVLREKYDDAAEMMRRIGPNGPLKKEEYSTWPLFRWFRRSSQFAVAFKDLFGEEYKIVQKNDPPKQEETGESSEDAIEAVAENDQGGAVEA